MNQAGGGTRVGDSLLEAPFFFFFENSSTRYVLLGQVRVDGRSSWMMTMMTWRDDQPAEEKPIKIEIDLRCT